MRQRTREGVPPPGAIRALVDRVIRALDLLAGARRASWRPRREAVPGFLR